MDESKVFRAVFDSSNPNWMANPEYNQLFLKTQINYFSDRLKKEGYVFLSDILISMGFKSTVFGHDNGWLVEEGSDFIAVVIDPMAHGPINLTFVTDGEIVKKIWSQPS